MTLIIAEGVDGSGKSTLVAELSHLTANHSRVRHCGPLKQHPLIEYEYSLINYKRGEDIIICDRWHVGELVYGPLYRGESKLTPAMKRHVELFLQSRGALRLIMATPYELLEKRLADRGEDFLQPQHLHLVADFYADYARSEGYETVIPNYTTDRLRSLLKKAKNLDRSTTPLAAFPSYVGPLKPTVLYIADTVEVSEARRPAQREALVPWAGTQGHYVLSALEQVGATGYGLALCDEDIHRLHSLLGKPRIVALGPRAAKTIHGGILSHVAPHPLTFVQAPYTALTSYGMELISG